MQPNGPGASSSTMFGVDTKLGLQGSANFKNGLSAVVQAVFDHRADNTYKPRFEWANLKYQFNEDWYVRAGRVLAPTFMVSDYRNVGYAQTAVRQPFDVYSLNPQNHTDGVDVGAKFKIADGVLNAQFTAGSVSEKIAKGDIKGHSALVNATYESGAHLFRAGYGEYQMDTVPAPASAFDLYESLVKAYGPAMGYTAPNIVSHDGRTVVWGLGYSYDVGTWLAQTEYVSRKGEGTLVKDADAWYVLAGYRIGKFTPYASYSKIMTKEPAPNAPPHTVGCAPGCSLATMVITTIDTLAATERLDNTTSIGVRYDFYKNMALKLQYERIKKAGSTTAPDTGGMFINDKAIWAVTPQTVNLTTMTLDFVF